MSFEHRFVPGRGSPATLLLLHGTGGDENDLLPLAALLAPQAAVLSPRGQVSEQGANRFFRRLAEGVFDVEDLHRRTTDLADFVTASAERYGFDSGRVVAVGFSNGANIAASVLLSRPQVLRAAVLFRAMVPFEPEERVDLTGRDVYIGAGRTDPLIPVQGTERLADLLRERRASVRLEWQPGGHALTRADVDQARAWIDDTGII